MQDLSSFIEKCTVVGRTFYYDTRFGNKIPENELHDNYKNGPSFTAKSISEIKNIIRRENTFYITGTSRTDEVHTIARFYITDKSFACREYNPAVIIPAILQSKHKDYLASRNHPYYIAGYKANYMEYPEDLLEDDPSAATNSPCNDQPNTQLTDKSTAQLTDTPSTQPAAQSTTGGHKEKKAVDILDSLEALPIHNTNDKYNAALHNLLCSSNRFSTSPEKSGSSTPDPDLYEVDIEYESPPDSPGSRIQEPDSDDCASCGHMGEGEEDDIYGDDDNKYGDDDDKYDIYGDTRYEDDDKANISDSEEYSLNDRMRQYEPAITSSEFERMERLFGNRSNPETKDEKEKKLRPLNKGLSDEKYMHGRNIWQRPYAEIKSAISLDDSEPEENDPTSDADISPRINHRLRKLPVKSETRDNMIKLIQEHNRKKLEQFEATLAIRKKMQELPVWEPIDQSLLPKLEERPDNLGYLPVKNPFITTQ